MADNEKPDLLSQPVTLFEITAVETDLMRVAAAVRYISIALDPGNLDGTKKCCMIRHQKILIKLLNRYFRDGSFEKIPI